MDPELQSHFLGLYCMVLADGIIEAPELETLYSIGRTQYGLSPEQISAAIRESGTSFVVPQSTNSKIIFLFNLMTIALADGKFDHTERELFRRYALRLNFMKENIDGIIDFMTDCVKHKMTVDEVIAAANNN